LLITDRSRGPEPWFLLTGDTLFVGSVGRPDLPGSAEASARERYRSLYCTIMPLPDTIEIYPAHISGSVRGASISGKPASTLGSEKRFNPLLSFISEAECVQAITKDALPKPGEMTEILAHKEGRAQLL